jgi:hypothetical protein
MLGLFGVTDMEDSVAEVTLSVVFPALPPKEAVIVVESVARALARPLIGLIVATSVFDEVHAACLVMSWLVPSEFVAVAVNCWVTPTGMLGLTGVTAIKRSPEGVLLLLHAVKNAAKDPRNNIAKINLIFFMKALQSFQPGVTVL